jgi:hypothetical protein
VSTVPQPPTGSAVPRTTLVTADLHVSSGFSAVQIVAADIGPDLVRASGPPDAISAPVVTLTGSTVMITQPQGAAPISVLSVQLAQPVSWQVDLDGGASTASLDLHTTRARCRPHCWRLLADRRTTGPVRDRAAQPLRRCQPRRAASGPVGPGPADHGRGCGHGDGVRADPNRYRRWHHRRVAYLALRPGPSRRDL